MKKLYCDGVLKGEKTIANGLSITTDYGLELGHTTASSSNSSKRYRGGMDEFMVFDYAWSAEEVAAEYNSIPVPAPTAHWTFDGDDPLADTTGNYPLEVFRANNAQPNVTFESGDSICGKAARFTSTSGCLRRETFPEGVIPAGKTEFTLVVRYRPDTTQINSNISRIVGWETTDAAAMFALGTEKSDVGSVRALTAGQVRQVAEQLEASKGKSATSTVTPTGVLGGQPDVTIAAGATLAVASVEEIGNLSGAGTVALATFGRLNVASANGFAGTVTGDGVVGVADDAEIDFGDGSSPLLVIDRSLALGANVTVKTTATMGRLLIAQAPSFLDSDNLETWTATTGGRDYHFAIVQNGNVAKLYLIMRVPTIVFCR